MDFAREWKHYKTLAIVTFAISVVANVTIIVRNVGALIMRMLGSD